jgi:hypothetical protein
MKTFTKIFLTLLIVNYTLLTAKSQNTAITDDSGYSPNSSAMLDVKSTTKGVLIPRLTTIQRNEVSSPATGLLVFDADENSFYFFNGTSWINLSSDNANGIIGYTASDKVYLKDVNNNFGIGTTTPTNKLEVKADADNGIDQAIFNVVNNQGDTVFAVYPQGVRINVYDDPLTKAVSKKGGFAVGGFKPAKGTTTNEYLRITPDSIRMYFEEVPAGKAASSKGGFAVGGFKPAKAGVISDVLTITNESTKIYTTDPDAGFGVEDAAGSGYMKLTPENYFIGHQAGELVSTGKHNTFLGYQAGSSNTEGWDNIFVGYQAGFSNVGYSTTKGANNIFIGNKAGYNNKGAAFGEYGHDNIFIGKEAGFNNVNGPGNLFIGVNAGFNNIGSSSNDGGYNVFIGNQAGFENKSGASNVYVGLEAGKTDTSGSGNAYVGQYAGRSAIGHSNSFIGNSTGGNLKGNGNACFGSYAGYTDPLSHDVNNNTLIGYSAGQWIVSGGGNTILGNNAGYYFDEGDNNVFIGTESGKGSGSGLNNPGSGNVFIGYQSGFWETGDNKLYIENSESSQPLIYGDFSTNKVTINDVLKLRPIDSAPSNPSQGEIYVGTNNHIYCYLGGIWKQLD